MWGKVTSSYKNPRDKDRTCTLDARHMYMAALSGGFELLERRDRKGELLCGPVRVPSYMIPRCMCIAICQCRSYLAYD